MELGAIVFGSGAVSCTPLTVNSYNWPVAIVVVANKTVLSFRHKVALFTTTPVNSLLLFATLRDDEMVETGTVMLGMGLYALLPTLPDPYAANVSPLRRDRGRLDAPELRASNTGLTRSTDPERPSRARKRWLGGLRTGN